MKPSSALSLESKSDVAAEFDAAGPAWDIMQEYPGLGSNEFIHDLAIADSLVEEIKSLVREAEPMWRAFESAGGAQEPLVAKLIAISELVEQTRTIYNSLLTFTHCVSDVDGKNEAASKMSGRLVSKRSALAAELKPMDLFLLRAPASLMELYLAHPHTAPEAYYWQRQRELADTRLSEAEEVLLERLFPQGPAALGSLYQDISSHLRCAVACSPLRPHETEEMGLAQAAGQLRDRSEFKRHAAWAAIQNAWKPHEHAVGAVLNGLAGWRLEVLRTRAKASGREIHFLDFPAHNAGVKRETLSALMQAAENAIPVGRRAMRAMAHASGKTVLDPWDLLAASPDRGTTAQWTFKEGLHLVRDAFAAVAPEFGNFVDMMEKNRWIEARVLPNKRQGAYCTRFAKSRTPRVFQTYMGSLSDVRTLAHELGHAYHSWVMRDLAHVETHYPMTLAETASLFAESALAAHLATLGTGLEFEVAWSESEGAAAHLLNIPARFTFERDFYEQRLHAPMLTPKELGDLTEQAWKHWYGDSLSALDRQFWMTKLHFSMAGVNFYNFPYTFGALFALSVAARRKEWGAEFMPRYNALLRDTGRMSAEEVARRHLGADISTPEFWATSIAQIEHHVGALERLNERSKQGRHSSGNLLV